MRKSQSLRTKWMLLTTSLTFFIFLLFSLFIIYFISVYLKQQEVQSVKRNIFEIARLLDEKSPGALMDNDVRASISDAQQMYLFNNQGDLLFKSKNIEIQDLHPLFEKSNTLVVNEQKEKDIPYMSLTAPVHTVNFSGYIMIVQPMTNYYNGIQYMIILASMFGLTALFLTAVISYLYSNQITKPIRKLSNKMKQIKRDGFQNKLSMSTSYYETDDMIETFNDLMEELEAAFNQQKQFVEDASHELRTPLQIIDGHLNLINRWGKNNKDILDESLHISIEEMNRINKLVEELLILTKDKSTLEQATIEEIDINEEIKSRINAIKALHDDYQFDFNTNKEVIKLHINRMHFEQILLIFLDNAIKYDTINKKIQIRTHYRNKLSQIEIIDHGEGIPKEDIPHVFDRFYRVDKSRARSKGGNGLGLSIAQKLISTYNGHVEVESIVNQYTKIIIQFRD